MPQIKGYDRQVGTPANIQKSDISTQTAGMQDEALARVGQSVEQLGEKVYKWDTRKDVHDIHLRDAELRAKYEQRIIQETQAGTIDSQKILEDFKKESSDFTPRTGAGQDYLDEQMSSLETSITKSSAMAQAKVAGELSAAQWSQTMSTNADTIRHSPSTVWDSLKSSYAAIDADVSLGTMSPADGMKLKEQVGDVYANASLTGFAESGFGGPQKAQNLLESGAFDQYLSEKARKSITSTLRTYKNAEEKERKRIERLNEDAQAKATESWKQDNLQGLVDHTLSVKDIMNSPMKAEQKRTWINALAVDKKQTDPLVYSDIAQRIMLPENDPNRITSQDQIMNFVGKGIQVKDVDELTKFIDETPQGRALSAQRKTFMDAAKAQITSINQYSFNKTNGYFKYAQLISYVQQKEQEMVKAGKNPAEIYNVNSKESIWREMNKFVPTGEDLLNEGSFNTTTEDDTPVDNDSKRKQGESASDYLKRTGGGK